MRVRLVLIAAAAMLMAISCGSASSDVATGTANPANPAGSANPASTVADTANNQDSGPDLTVLGQGSLEGTDIVVWFWAEW